jgi:sugar lactone lactonase YvrE
LTRRDQKLAQIRVLVGDGIIFPESPRWHGGKLWFADIFGRKVMTTDLAGRTQVVREFDDLTSGIGFLPDGTPIVVQMEQKKLVRVTDGGVHADLSSYGGSYLNDMVVDDRTGRAWVDLLSIFDVDPTLEHDDAIIVVEPNGESRIAARGQVSRPNGIALSPDRRTLISAMGILDSLVAYTIAADGTLADRRIYADTRSEHADGICVDAEGGVWSSTLHTHRFIRYRRDGEIDRVVDVSPHWSVACALGGPDGKTLFMATAEGPPDTEWGLHGNLHLSTGYIEITEVDVPGVDFPRQAGAR